MCCCEQNNTLPSYWPFGLNGLNATDPFIASGSVVSWTGRILMRPNGGWTESVDVLDPYVEPKLRQALTDAGFLGSEFESSGFFDHNNYIAVITGVDYGALNHVAQVIEGAIYSLGYYPVRGRYELVSSPSRSSRVIQPGQQGGGGDVQPPRSNQEGGINWPSLPSIFGGSSTGATDSNPLDWIASRLGVGQTEAALIGAGLAVGAIVLLKRLL